MHGFWTEVARNDAAQRLATWPWRLGLGWIVGRRFALVSTQTEQGTIRRTLVPAHIVEGDILLAGLEEAWWQQDIALKPVATVQVYPGPLSARIAPIDEVPRPDGVRWHRATATGGVTPAMVGPDQIWMWAAVPFLWRLRRTQR
jgi:hypothetical protein